MADQKPSNRERVKEIVAGIEQNIQELFQSERYFDYLRTMSRFHSYSVNNTILIHMQRPNASMPAAGFNKWKQFGRHVKKGEKGLTIIAPTPLKKKIEEMRLDPDTKTPVLDRDGNIIIDEKTVEIPLFKPVKVFTADQTDGKPLPSLAIPLTGDVQQYEAFMEALRRTSPMPISFAPLDPNTDGLCSFTKQAISIREGMSQVQTVCATVHEIGHAVLHDREKDRLSAAAGNTDKEPPKAKDKRTMEVEAESVSFAVCQYYGIDTSANSLGYIATWSKDKSLPELKASLETITKTVSGLISTIDRHFAEICKERGIDLTAQPEQAAPAAELPDTSEKFVMDLFQRMDDLHGSGQIQNPYGSLEPDAVRDHYLGILRHGNFSSAFTLLHELAGQTDTLTVSELRGRLDNLRSEWDAGLSYEIKPYIPDSNIDRFYLEASRQAEDGFRYNEVIFAGSQADCAELKQRLEENTITTYAVRELGGEDWPAPEAPSASQPDFEQTAPSIPPPPEQADEALYLLDDSVYLHIQASDGGWDYTLYTKHDMAQIDGGQLDAPGLSVTGVVEHIRQAEEIGTLAVDVVSLEVLEELRDHADHALAAETPQPEQDRDYAGELREHFAQEDAALLDTALDEYPMPDSTLTLDDLAELGYSETDLLPLSRDRGGGAGGPGYDRLYDTDRRKPGDGL